MKKYIMLIILFLLTPNTSIHCSSASSNHLYLTALGDSITHGSGDPTKQGYIERVRMAIEDEKGITVHASNYGVPKYTSENILMQLKDQNVKKQIKKASYIILYIGTNDFRKSAGYKLNLLNVGKINEGRLKFKANLHKILYSIRNENVDSPIMVLGLYHPYVHCQNQKEILKLIEQWNDEIISAREDFEKTFFVPTLDLFTNRPKDQYFSDVLHLNSSGYQLMADRVFESILQLETNSTKTYNHSSGTELISAME